MSDNEVGAILFLCIAAVTIVSVMAAAYLKARGMRSSEPACLRAVEDRLARIEQAVDAIAVEVEPISEGQRFTTKLLAERSGEPVRVAEASSARGGGHHAY